MIRSLYTAATGMEAQQLYMDTISNNLANVNTNSFKREKVQFQDLMYQTLREPGVRNVEGSLSPAGIEVGLGVKPGATERLFDQGSLTQTGNSMDTAIKGDGFYQIAMPDGSISYTRDGQFVPSNDGTLQTTDGFPVYPQLTIPSGASSITIGADGQVTATMPGQTNSTVLGKIELARFVNPSGLKAMGSNLYSTTDASGAPIVSDPGVDGMGTVLQGYTEASNVQIVDEMVGMISAQRAYEIVSKAITVSDSMMQVTNAMKAEQNEQYT